MKRVMMTAFAFLPAFLLVFGCGTPQPIMEGISLDGIDLSGCTVAEVAEQLDSSSGERIALLSYTLRLPDRDIGVNAAQLGAFVDAEKTLELLRTGAAAPAELSSVTDADPSVLTAFCTAFAEWNSTRAVDAQLIVSNDAIHCTAARAGIRIDAEKLAELLDTAIESGQSATVNVPYTEIAPTVSQADIAARCALVASYTTSFASAPHHAKNRVFNIEKAAACINKTVLLPGEIFDTNAILGDRNEENGWKKAAAIRAGAYVQEYGGGVCQVSSTLFNAVLMADLSILERHPHSWPMSYVPIGRDATISTGGKNFLFTNSSTENIYIFATVDTDTCSLTVSIYGKPLADGRYITVSSERTGTLPAADDVWMLDESLPYNTSVSARDARAGKTSRTLVHIHASDGTELETRVIYEDIYRSIGALSYLSADLYYGAEN